MNEKELEQLKKERDEFLAGWQRAKADLANYKKEEKERMASIAGYVKEQLFEELFAVLDNLERAEGLLKKGEEKNEIAQGFLLIARQLKEFLSLQGVREVEAEGKKFDPRVHEAVGEAQEGKSGHIVEVVEKGYMLGEKLLRPAKVKVAA